MFYTIPVLLIAILGNMSKFLHAFNASFYNSYYCTNSGIGNCCNL